jgi:hypothetical protein
LKARFGGLKSFVAHYFPAEIVWRGRNGLDDLYDVSFTPAAAGGTGAWKAVPSEPSADLWSAVTNPSIYVQFAWSANDESLLQASAGVPLTEGLVAVEKLTKADYQNISVAFVSSLENIDASIRARAIERSGSNVEFTRLVVELGFLAKWEEFRVDQALRLFADRLGTSGAQSTAVSRWDGVLRSSQQQARSRRLQKTITSMPAQRSQPQTDREFQRDEVPDARAVAIKAMEFLSDSDIHDLNLPLGSVMRAVGALLKRQ